MPHCLLFLALLLLPIEHEEARLLGRKLTRTPAVPEADSSMMQTEREFRTYIADVARTFGLSENLIPEISPIIDRLARAEFAASQHAEIRIQETTVIEVFNKLATKMDAPREVSITLQELRYFRDLLSLKGDGLVRREADGSLEPTCRPLEATYLLFLLASNGGVPAGIKALVAGGVLPSQIVRSGEPEHRLTSVGGLQASSVDIRNLAYVSALKVFMRAHAEDWPTVVSGVLDNLGMPN